MTLYLVHHEHADDACPGANPAMGQMLLQHLSALNARSYGVSMHGEAVIRGKHQLYLIVEADDEGTLRQFMAPFAQAGSVEILPAAKCSEVVARGGCAAVV